MFNTKHPGCFVVLEGIDGAGTTTQARRLGEALRSRGLGVHPTHEPSAGPIGTMIRQVLSKRLVVPTSEGPRAPGWTTMALLFAADRMDHLDSEVLPRLAEGMVVLSDRYDYSSVAYQSVTSGGSTSSSEEVASWVTTLNQHAQRPDLTLVLHVSAETAAARRGQRQGTEEIYEVNVIQQQLALFYRDIDRYFPNDHIVHINAEQSVDRVSEDILTHALPLFASYDE